MLQKDIKIGDKVRHPQHGEATVVARTKSSIKIYLPEPSPLEYCNYTGLRDTDSLSAVGGLTKID